MRLSSAIGVGACCTVLVASLAISAGFARERGPKVEVVCPVPPTPVRMADTAASDKSAGNASGKGVEKQALAYELHVTNFDEVPLTLQRLEVFADSEQTPALSVMSGQLLSASMEEVGPEDPANDSKTIGPGKRGIVYVWIEAALDRPAPGTLRHSMVFSRGSTIGEKTGDGSPTETILAEFPVTVNHEAPLILKPPFDGGIWAAGEGPSNNSGHRRSITAIDGQIHLAQRFAIDWVKVGPDGNSFHDGTAHNENWWGYGEPVKSVADGEATQVLDGIPENTPRVLPAVVTLDNIAGNYVIVRIAPNRYVTYAHLQNGSIKVHAHDKVRAGDVLGRLGNTGSATAPHLHFQVTDGDSVLQSEGVPFVFEKYTDLGPGADYEVDKHPSIPREYSLPGNLDVIDFTSAKKHKSR
jgi:murein DD-endopeptidase MepM/ murein hydrolase activator NlpD